MEAAFLLQLNQALTAQRTGAEAGSRAGLEAAAAAARCPLVAARTGLGPGSHLALPGAAGFRDTPITPPLSAGEQLAAFRTQDGQAHVVDAYCPHLGANLAAGGRVVGDCIECPFHGWQFRGEDGKCTSIPYAEKGEPFPGLQKAPAVSLAPWASS